MKLNSDVDQLNKREPHDRGSKNTHDDRLAKRWQSSSLLSRIGLYLLVTLIFGLVISSAKALIKIL